MDATQRASLAATISKAQAQQKGQATFLGVKPPPEIEQMAITLSSSNVSKDVFRKILTFVVEYMKGTEITEDHWAKLKETTSLEEVILWTIFGGSLRLFKTATRSRTPLDIFVADCVDVVKIPREYVTEMGLVIQNWRDNLEEKANLRKRIRQPGLFNMKWRIDVTILTSSLNRLFKPSILVQMTDTDGNIHTFEMSTSKFHHLRMQIAMLIKELDATENHPILQIDKVKQ